MCTAITYKTKDSYFGRNLDLEYSYNETVTITPRNYKLEFRKADSITTHYAIIGMAYVKDGYPLYYDGINEKGLGIAGLNFPKNAFYNEPYNKKNNIAPFEFIPYVLSQCSKISEVKSLLNDINLVNIDFSPELQATELHWMISDTASSIVVESIEGHLNVFDNPVDTLTNNPPFDMQLFNLNNYMNLSVKEPVNNFIKGLSTYSRGMGAMGLPGDLSSQSRFVRAVFTLRNAVSNNDESSSVSQFFHILSAVEQQRGCVKIEDSYEITVYSSCCNLNKGIYYYRTYDNSQIAAVNMYRENLDRDDLICYPLIKDVKIHTQN